MFRKWLVDHFYGPALGYTQSNGNGAGAANGTGATAA